MRAGRGAGLCSVLAAAPCSLRRGEPRGWQAARGARVGTRGCALLLVSPPLCRVVSFSAGMNMRLVVLFSHENCFPATFVSGGWSSQKNKMSWDVP